MGDGYDPQPVEGHSLLRTLEQADIHRVLGGDGLYDLAVLLNADWFEERSTPDRRQRSWEVVAGPALKLEGPRKWDVAPIFSAVERIRGTRRDLAGDLEGDPDTFAAARPIKDVLLPYVHALPYRQWQRVLAGLLHAASTLTGLIHFLEKKNHHAADDDIYFDEERHLYFARGGRPFDTSVTSWVKKFMHEDFVADDAIAMMRRSTRKPLLTRDGGKYAVTEPDGTVRAMTNEEIKALWETERDEAARYGTELHFIVEVAMNAWAAGRTVVLPHCAEGDQARAWFEDARRRGWKPYRAEWIVWSDKDCLPGSVDGVFEDDLGVLHIVDWKTCKSIPTKAFTKRWGDPPPCGAPPFTDVQDCKFSKYALQLNAYALKIQRDYGKEVGTVRLTVFNRVFHAGLRGSAAALLGEMQAPLLTSEMEEALTMRINDVAFGRAGKMEGEPTLLELRERGDIHPCASVFGEETVKWSARRDDAARRANACALTALSLWHRGRESIRARNAPALPVAGPTLKHQLARLGRSAMSTLLAQLRVRV